MTVRELDRPVSATSNGLGPPVDPERIVRPRKEAHIHMPIVVIDEERIWYENQPKGIEWDLYGFLTWLRDNWPTRRSPDGKTRSRHVPVMLVTKDPQITLLNIHEYFQNDEHWNFRLTLSEPSGFDPNPSRQVRALTENRISYMGWKYSKRRTHYMHPINPLDFVPKWEDYRSDLPNIARMYSFGAEVREWMRNQNMRFSASRGGLASQLLRDSRFYRKARRKVPLLTNEKARKALPGNCYIRMTEQGYVGGVYVIDQESAHHRAAQTVDLPDANSLFGYGRFGTESDKPFARPGSDIFDQLIHEHGLLRVRVWVPKIPSVLGTAVPPWMLRPGLQNVYLFTNELPQAFAEGLEIRHISYAWTSPDTDSGLKRYADWSVRHTNTLTPRQKSWLKPLLLSAYGVLGVRAHYIESASYRGVGKSEQYFLGSFPVTMHKKRSSVIIQSPIANCIHRGMIEAETRRLSIELAQRFHREGHTVVGVHADAVLVKDEGQQLPLLDSPWRIKDRLTNVRLVDDVSYTSDQAIVLPGRPRNAKRQVSRLSR